MNSLKLFEKSPGGIVAKFEFQTYSFRQLMLLIFLRTLPPAPNEWPEPEITSSFRIFIEASFHFIDQLSFYKICLAAWAKKLIISLYICTKGRSETSKRGAYRSPIFVLFFLMIIQNINMFYKFYKINIYPAPLMTL